MSPAIMENCTSNLTFDYYCLNDSFLQFLSSAHLKHGVLITAILVVAYSTIFILGFIGNITVILVILRSSQMKTVTNLFILNLAVADLFVVFFCVPGTLVANIFIPWVFDPIICKTMPYTQGVSVCASVYSLVAISVDRCRALYRPIGHAHGFSKTQAKQIIILIWTVGLVITSPWLLVFQVVYSIEDDRGYPFCQEDWPNRTYGNVYFISVHLILCFCLPLLVISVLNAVIWWNMNRFRQVSIEQELPLRYNIPGVTKLLCIITITFMLSWLPLYILMTKIKLFAKKPAESNSEEDNGLLEVLIPVAQLMGSFNSCVNPILYAFHNRKFRETVIAFLGKCRQTNSWQ